MRFEKQVAKLRMITKLRIAVSIVQDIKRVLQKRKNNETKKHWVKHSFCFFVELIYIRVKNRFVFSLVLLQGFFSIPGYHNNGIRVSDII